MTKATDSKFYALLSLSLLAVTLVALVIGNGSLIAANLGVSTGTAATVVNFLDTWSSVATVITIVGVFTGVGTIGSGVAATILAILKKEGKAKAAAF
ncbi:uberolysin/carnocyclin family circular bacteriocin [Bacillus safensis]|nr:MULTISPECIES: uberolysin/carnocyclin family circular bacteriocin [Bacillus]MBW4854124.1 uberolysin/carnocyclin family circular bacteriocin [Bacillaceae bacterium]MBW4857843.1 uberolysin/carnocyclin family circular bacteriocin [Bacillaceae bacterium]MCY7582826.1 uberolysin/carnocyclin family circular bacteriocin [Bacillus safensis]MCY7586203.1 uberolysin/carnocyclin family circular bacteriocin [Bacillus safensis]PRS22468.1 circular bacteriocin, circularin A/uberolysin family [Bacillus safens